MAKIGLKNFLFGVLHENNGTATYGTAIKPAKAISCNVDITSNDITLYADDALAESDSSFQSGSVTMTVDNEDLETLATLLGHTISNEEIVRKASDVAPYVGLGRLVTKIVNGTYKYKVEFLCKCQFSEVSQSDTTRAESIEYGTTEITGKVFALASGEWSKAKTFDSETSAQSYLEGLFGTASV